MVSARPRAFALIEAVVAATILGLGVSAVLTILSRSLAAQAEGEAIDLAARLADERLSLVLALGAESYSAAFPLEAACDPPFEQFRYRVEIAPPAAGADGAAYAVSATITWRTSASTRSITVHTLIAPRSGDDPDPDRKPTETVTRG